MPRAIWFELIWIYSEHLIRALHRIHQCKQCSLITKQHYQHNANITFSLFICLIRGEPELLSRAFALLRQSHFFYVIFVQTEISNMCNNVNLRLRRHLYRSRNIFCQNFSLYEENKLENKSKNPWECDHNMFVALIDSSFSWIYMISPDRSSKVQQHFFPACLYRCRQFALDISVYYSGSLISISQFEHVIIFIAK